MAAGPVGAPRCISVVIGPGRLHSALSPSNMRTKHDPREDKPSREAEFSSALWKLDRDWKEKPNEDPQSRPRRFILLCFLILLLYALSMGPAGLFVSLLPKSSIPGPIQRHYVWNRTASNIYVIIYYPIVWLDQNTAFHKPISIYLSLWGAKY